MGCADIIPGVSGGTVALILGIYERLVTAISRVDTTFIGHLTGRRWRDAAAYLDLKFLIPLGIGILAGVAVLGTVMHALLEHYLQFTLAAFFGMIGASCYLVGRLIHRWGISEFILLPLGALFAFWLVRQPALATPPDAQWYIFLCGVIGICAMILPGISGAFILLIMGKYHDITGIIKQTLQLELSVASITTVAVFGTGCVVGLLSFSKLLRWLLAHHGSATMAALCGFMAGSLYKIWPFQVDTTPEVEEFKHKFFQPVSLTEIPIDGRFWLTILIAIVAALLVLALDRFAVAPGERVVHDDPEA